MGNSISTTGTYTFSRGARAGSRASTSPRPSACTPSEASARARSAAPGRASSVSPWHVDHLPSAIYIDLKRESRAGFLLNARWNLPPPSPEAETDPSSASAKGASTPSSIWQTTTAHPKDGPVKGMAIARGCVSAGGIRAKWWRVRKGAHTISVGGISPHGHGAKTPSPAGHWPHSHWSRSVESWHVYLLLPNKMFPFRIVIFGLSSPSFRLSRSRRSCY
jgi:hypothetical protein